MKSLCFYIIRRYWGLDNISIHLIRITPMNIWVLLKFYFYKPYVLHAKLLQSCQTLCDPMDCSLSGSSVHRVLQAGKLECCNFLFQGSSQPRNWNCLFYLLHWQAGSLPLANLGSPISLIMDVKRKMFLFFS